MPEGFPISVAQNSGNMVHAQAPFRMFPNSVGMEYGFREEGYSSFRDFVNERCTALVVPFANVIRADPKADDNGWAHVRALSGFTVPIIPFGVGAQAPTMDIDAFRLGPGMAAFVKFLSERSPAVSVRGDFTRKVFAKYGSTENVYVTGCPSYFSRPEGLASLREGSSGERVYERLAYAGSLHHLPGPKAQLYKAVNEDLYLIEPVSAALHQFYLDCINGVADLKPAYFLAALLKEADWSRERLRDYMIRRYRLFRDLDSWLAFNREALDGTVGTRFHVNMASILSGVPAVWVVHDSRTEELCDRLSLPQVSAEDLDGKSYRQLLESADMDPMIRAMPENFSYFNEFLAAADLPKIPLPH